MKKSLVLLTVAVFLLTVSASAKMKITKYAISIDEPVTAQNTAAALAEFHQRIDSRLDCWCSWKPS